ncbi:MAG: glycosyltransferase family 39 protein [Elusimicrobia bacterium]|nr:glycosyltransferase family 39 protein [Elusimicrobiota bacterium]
MNEGAAPALSRGIGRRAAAAALLLAGAGLLFWRLGRPALWQDEAETALRAETILESGLPRTHLRGVLVTTQPSLARHEGNSAGVWTWNAWLPAYLVAGSFRLFGRSPWAARLPFALAGLLALWLWYGLFRDGEDDELAARRPWAPEAALALLALSAPYLLFCRQSRYYALLALGNALVLKSWRRLLAGRRGGVLALALSLQFLFHSCYAFFAAAALALAADALLRFDECLPKARFWGAALLSAALAAPAAWYLRVWERPGNHLYGPAEALEFLKTFLLWLAAFAVPVALVAAERARRWALLAGGFILLCGLIGEGAWSRVAAAAVWAALVLLAARRPAPYGVLNLRRVLLLLVAATLGLLSLGAAEPYGRYLAGLLPACAYLAARSLSALGRGRFALVAALTALAAAGNALFLLPLKAARALAAPGLPAESVSGMMRRRLRDLPLRSDLSLFAEELASGPRGYVESVAAAMAAGGGKTFFADGDELSLLFATGLRPVYPGEFASIEPDWLLPSPWLALDPASARRVETLAASGRYVRVPIPAPRLLWQNNPDPLFRDFSPRRGPLPLLRRRP